MDFTDESLTGSAGLAFLAAAARRCGLFGHFRGFAPCRVRRRGASDSENLWSLVSLLARGSGTLSDVDSRKGDGDGATRTVLGLSSKSHVARVAADQAILHETQQLLRDQTAQVVHAIGSQSPTRRMMQGHLDQRTLEAILEALLAPMTTHHLGKRQVVAGGQNHRGRRRKCRKCRAPSEVDKSGTFKVDIDTTT